MSTTEQSGTTADLAARLGQVRVGLRQDLEVTRHLFRGQPSYVVRDPVTFQSHRLEPADYQVFVSIEASRPLAEILAGLVERGLISAGDQEAFYEFIVQLHRLNFLNLPISDEKQLYKRYLARQQARRKEKLMGFLFLRIPLVNPDAFLERTIRYGRLLFSRCFFMVWLLVVGTAAVVGLQNWDRFLEPLQGVLATENLPLIWLVLIGLKVFHELGHAYACKHFGGYVPELQPAEKGTQCIEPDEFMRENHMLLLDDWRLSVVRCNSRVYEATDGQEYYMGLANPTNPEELPLQTGACLSCHTDKTAFCDTCHSYSGAEPGCWDCHVSGEE